MKYPMMFVSGSAAIAIILFTILAGFDWIHKFGELDSYYWFWALGFVPLLVIVNIILFVYWLYHD